MSKKSFHPPPLNGFFGGPFWDNFGIIFGVDFRSESWHRVGTVFGSLLVPFGVQV